MIRGLGMAFSVLWMAPGMVFAGSVAKKGCPGGKIDWSKIKERFSEGASNIAKKGLLGRPGAQEAVPSSNTGGGSPGEAMLIGLK